MEGAFTTAATTSATLTLADLERAAAAIKALGPEPFGEYMRKEGFDPKDGCYLILPTTLVNKVAWPLPSYVRFSRVIDAPVMIRDPMHEFREGVRRAMNRSDTTRAAK